MRQLPTPDDLLPDLMPVLRGLFEALELGIQLGIEFFDESELEHEPHVLAGITKVLARKHLRDAGGGLPGVEVITQTNAGIRIIHGACSIRVLKSGKVGLPAPGRSEARWREYRQLTFLDTDPQADPRWFERDNLGVVNLVAIWSLDSRKKVLGLRLACPKPGTSGARSFDQYWSVNIPHPSETIDVGSHIDSTDAFPGEDLRIGLPPVAIVDLDDLGLAGSSPDLPIELPRDETNNAENEGDHDSENEAEQSR